MLAYCWDHLWILLGKPTYSWVPYRYGLLLSTDALPLWVSVAYARLYSTRYMAYGTIGALPVEGRLRRLLICKLCLSFASFFPSLPYPSSRSTAAKHQPNVIVRLSRCGGVSKLNSIAVLCICLLSLTRVYGVVLRALPTTYYVYMY